MRMRRFGLIVFSASCLGACGFLPPSQQQEFSVTAAQPAANAGVFGNTDPRLIGTLAAQGCVEGYDKVTAQTLTVDPGALDVWRVRCAPHDSWAWLPF
jgi:hypothetical protein